MSTALHTLAVFEQQIDAGVAPGGQLCISAGGKLMLDAAYGVLGPGLGPTTPDVVYDLASLTKPLATTYLAAKLYQEGKLDLQAPLTERATFADALEHCAGFIAHKHFHREAHGKDAIVALARAEPLAYPPRTQAVYSDIGFILLGDAIERLAGQSLRELFVRDRFGVFYCGDERPTDAFAPTEHGLTGTVHDENARAMGGIAGHAGLFGTARDVLALGERWLSAWHGTDQTFLTQTTVRRFWTPSVVPGSTRVLGWDRPVPTGSSTGDVWPLDAVGHLGFTGTSLWIAPRQSLVVAMVTNRVVFTQAELAPIKQMRRAVHAAAWQELTT